MIDPTRIRFAAPALSAAARFDGDLAAHAGSAHAGALGGGARSQHRERAPSDAPADRACRSLDADASTPAGGAYQSDTPAVGRSGSACAFTAAAVPVQRTRTQGAIGTACAAGDAARAQGALRNPAGPKTTHVSGAPEFTLCE